MDHKKIAEKVRKRMDHRSHGGEMDSCPECGHYADGGVVKPLPGSDEDRKKIEKGFKDALGFYEGGEVIDIHDMDEEMLFEEEPGSHGELHHQGDENEGMPQKRRMVEEIMAQLRQKHFMRDDD